MQGIISTTITVIMGMGLYLLLLRRIGKKEQCYAEHTTKMIVYAFIGVISIAMTYGKGFDDSFYNMAIAVISFIESSSNYHEYKKYKENRGGEKCRMD